MKLMLVKRILLISTLGIVWRTVRRLCILMLRCKGLKGAISIKINATIILTVYFNFHVLFYFIFPVLESQQAIGDVLCLEQTTELIHIFELWQLQFFQILSPTKCACYSCSYHIAISYIPSILLLIICSVF